jgi:hypothetical protein
MTRPTKRRLTVTKLTLIKKPCDGTITSLATNGTIELSCGLYNHGGADLSVEEYARTRNLTDFQMTPEDKGQLRTEAPAGENP